MLVHMKQTVNFNYVINIVRDSLCMFTPIRVDDVTIRDAMR